ncbi:hypothetical protein PFISCL1PPCAC_9665 [Pristionchus fissidentatus]|uniref:PPM-type phosphatase domain-containing protein n=1 Tax=Pristionchus fissidentatus TaxID=1538716 RepID=A0AAV5VJE5_9BILA|nr:hypothetical protein PFISCL1PPCAC_9665 [Pristionchus fissidentatus]
MTLCAVSSNEGAQSQGGALDIPMEDAASKSKDAMVGSQDSGISLAPSSPTIRHLGTNLRITACANQGGRKYMEDRVHVEVKRSSETGEILWTFVAVYDGHGGPEASQYCRKWLLHNIQIQNGFDSEDDDEFLEAIRSGFLHTHHQMWKDVDTWERTASGYPSTAGTTASCAFIRRGKLYVGHVGDSAILLTTRSDADRFMRLTEDHKPESPSEKKRIEASGGQVMQKAMVHRVVWTRPVAGHTGPVRKSTPVQTIPFLAVARSLGDFWSYCEDTQEFAVSPNPDVCVVELVPDHHSIVLCSDGLTNVLSADVESAIMHGLAVEEEQKRWFTNPSEQPNHARIMMRRTLQHWRRYRADNVSVVTVVFDRERYPTFSQSMIESTEGEETKSESDDGPVELPLSANLDAELMEHPTCLIKVTNEKTLRYKTTVVPMKYGGAFDNNFHSVGLVGPGFITHDMENASMDAAESASAASLQQQRRLEEYYDILGVGERDITPENQPPTTTTNNLTNTGAPPAVSKNGADAKSAPRFTNAAAVAIDEMRRGGEAAVAAAHAAAAALAADERPTTPQNRSDVGFAVLRNSRSSAKRRSIFDESGNDEEDEDDSIQQPSTSNAVKTKPGEESKNAEESEVEGQTDEVHVPVILQSLPFDDEESRREELLRTPSPIGDQVEGGKVVRSTPLCNTTSTEREIVKRVTRSAAATTSFNSTREMIVVERPATRRSSARKLLKDDCESNGSPTPRTPKPVLVVGETIASRTRSRGTGETTPPTALSKPSTSASGSRKRPRAAMETLATPLMAKISLSEMNENDDLSLGSDDSPKSGTPNKWRRGKRKPLVPSSSL